MELLGARIQLNPRPATRAVVACEVGILGHCPGRARYERFLVMSNLIDEIKSAGFGSRILRLQQLHTELSNARANNLPSRDIESILNAIDLALSHLPIPLRSTAEFDDIFPLARTSSTYYGSVLAGAKSWTPQAIDDFFANGGEKLWLVRIPENEDVNGFLPEQASLLDVERLRGLACLLPINRLALVMMPDLERLQIPAQLPDIPRLRLPNPDPVFLPLGTLIDDGHRERRNSSEIFAELPPQPLLNILRRLLQLLQKHRPDVQAIFTVPLSYSNTVQSPAIDHDAVQLLDRARHVSGAALLRQVQLIFPYLRQANSLRSAAGVIAGAIAKNTAQRGAWRSISLQPLVSIAQPYPPVNMQDMIALRDSPGLGIIYQKAGQLKLDDERLMVPALHQDDYVLPGENARYSARLSGMRSAEVVRFLGYLKRELRELGEHLIFNVDASDPRPQLALERFFTDLYKAGALRGPSPQEAFRVTRGNSPENVLAFDIEIAPAFPIDKLVITFINRDGEWTSGVGNG